MRRTICGVLAALAVAFGTAPLASAAATAPAVIQQNPDDDGDGWDNGGVNGVPGDNNDAGNAGNADPANTADNNDNNNDDDGDNGWWGLLGLLGLLGLGGLFRRGPKRGAMAGYPTARSEEPPANAYPPATPRKAPPA